MCITTNRQSADGGASVIARSIRDRFTVPPPLLLAGHPDAVKLEIKPYLQPFERELAMRELNALLKPGDNLTEEHGIWLAHTNVSDEFLRERLTYWQRAGRNQLEPTLQKSLEFTQNGSAQVAERGELHRARRLRYGPHDLHEYRGKFFPQLVRSLINISGVPESALVLDPMCGSGTTPCEAVASGCAAIGADLNPLSVLIAGVKATVPALDPVDFYKNAHGRLDKLKFPSVDPAKIWDESDLRYLGMWFDPAAISDLASIVSEIGKIRLPAYRDLFRVFLSNIVRSVSWQKATDLRVRKEVLPYKPGAARERFLAEAASQIDRIHPYLSVLKLRGPANVEIRRGNAVDVASIFPERRGAVDLLVTSPPYATALPYLDTDRLSLIVLGLLPRKSHGEAEHDMVGTREVSERERREAWAAYEVRRSELPAEIANLIDRIAAVNHGDGVGFRRRNLPALLGKYFLSMLDAMRSARDLMKPGAFGYYVVGNNSTEVDGGKIEIPTDRFLFDLSATAGWTPIEKISMELIVSRDIFRENRGSSETILCFQA
jgi:site-specific DNA-methyltransferase (cytosine-N4-specific)